MKNLIHYPLTAKDVEIDSEEIVYQGFFCVRKYKLRFRRFAGGWSNVIEREINNQSKVAAVLPYDPVLDKVVLIEQFRVGALKSARPWLVEIVAGIAEENESTETMINRELKEEGNLIALDMIKIYDYWVSPGGSAEHLTLYCAKVDASQADGIFGLETESEDILVRAMEPERAFDMLEKNAIKNSATIIAIQWLKLNKEKIRLLWS